MKLTIGYFYPKELNLYGDTGNIEVLSYRANQRNIDVEVINIDSTINLTPQMLNNINFVFMGGGPDSGQKVISQDFFENKGPLLKQHLQNGCVGLFICGAYQLLGNFYRSADGSELPGLGFFDVHTEHFGTLKPRCIGNVVCKLNKAITQDKAFDSTTQFEDLIVGFENHGGRTFLTGDSVELGDVILGHGNNSQDKKEGCQKINSFGTYFHGPILSRNPHFADYLIALTLQITAAELKERSNLYNLQNPNDNLILKAHTATVNSA